MIRLIAKVYFSRALPVNSSNFSRNCLYTIYISMKVNYQVFGVNSTLVSNFGL